MKTYFKIVKKENGVLKTVHHSINGSRVLQENTWIKGQRKTVRDGVHRPYYTSGIHVLPSEEDAKEYIRVFKHTKGFIVVPVLVKGIRKKEKTRVPVYLVDQIKIIK